MVAVHRGRRQTGTSLGVASTIVFLLPILLVATGLWLSWGWRTGWGAVGRDDLADQVEPFRLSTLSDSSSTWFGPMGALLVIGGIVLALRLRRPFAGASSGARGRPALLPGRARCRRSVRSLAREILRVPDRPRGDRLGARVSRSRARLGVRRLDGRHPRPRGRQQLHQAPWDSARRARHVSLGLRQAALAGPDMDATAMAPTRSWRTWSNTCRRMPRSASRCGSTTSRIPTSGRILTRTVCIHTPARLLSEDDQWIVEAPDHDVGRCRESLGDGLRYRQRLPRPAQDRPGYVLTDVRPTRAAARTPPEPRSRALRRRRSNRSSS